MIWKAINKYDTVLYKGIAILMIISHNFLHLFPKPRENEFTFSKETFYSFLHLLITEPENIIRVSSSFLGHFGVQIFIFLSAYGLTKQYLNKEPSYFSFIKKRILKIYPSFILAILFWTIITGYFFYDNILAPFEIFKYNLNNIILKLSLLSNFFPGRSITPIGPWWFIPFIFQFYFVFPFIFKTVKRSNKSLLFISLISLLLLLFTDGHIGRLNLYFTIIGHLPEFCIGIYMAKNDNQNFNIPSTAIYASLFIFILGNIYKPLWYISHLSFLIILLFIFQHITKWIKHNNISTIIFSFIGKISLQIFLVNGFLREPLITIAIQKDDWFVTLYLCFIFIIITTFAAYILYKIEQKILHSFSPVIGKYFN
jgi:peptidoglycan/LPS O-acetylase OafA/YrhL